MNLGSYIYELLFRYDCVIVPGFGGFVGNYSPAHIHPSQHKFYPPSKRITFNKYLQNNDGLLANLVSQHESCSFEKAMELIRNEVGNMEMELKSGKKIVLDKIGSFLLDQELNVQFEPTLSSNFLLDSYGLHAFQVLPANKSTSNETLPEKAAEPRIIPIDRKRDLNRLAKIAAAASLFFAMVWIPLKTDILEQAGIDRTFSRLFHNENGVYQPVKTKWELSSLEESKKLTDELSVNEDFVHWSFLEKNERAGSTPENIVINKVEKAEKTKPEINSVTSTGPYHVVGGCFEFSDNARKLVRKLRRKGYSAIMAGMHNGLHVVSYGSFTGKNDAMELLKNVKQSENSQAWLLIK